MERKMPDYVLRHHHEGNHGEQGNPHPQYELYKFNTPGNAAVQTNPFQWTKIADQIIYMPSVYLPAHPKTVAAPTPKRILLTFLLDSIFTDSGFLSGIVTLRFNLYQNLAGSRFSVDITPLSDGDNVQVGQANRIAYDDLIRMYVTDNGDGTYRLQVFLKYYTSYQGWKIKCLQADFNSGYIDYDNTDYVKSWNGFYAYQNENRMAKWFFQNANLTAPINENDASFPVASATTLLIKNGITKGTLSGVNLPTPSAIYQGKLFTQEGTSQNLGNDTIYICIKQGGTFVWQPLSPTGTYTTPNTGSSDNNKWTKIASAKVTAQYGVVMAEMVLSSGQTGVNQPNYGRIYLRVKQQAALGSAPDIELIMLESYLMKKENVMVVISQNDATATVADLYVQIVQQNEIMQYTCPMYRSITGSLTFTPNTALIASLPAGTQIKAFYSDMNVQQVGSLPTASATYRGQVVYVQGNGTTTADTAYICLQSSTGTYSWKTLITG